MSNSDSDGGPENQWEDRGELAWNEFDWERYLREQDGAIARYLRLYDACAPVPDRVDQVAEKMNWGQDDWSDEGEPGASADAIADDDVAADEAEEVYTLHKNPIFIATKAIYLSLNRGWEPLASDATQVPQATAVSLMTSLRHGEDQAVQAIHALDFGDFAMAISLFKRALSALNGSLAIVHGDGEPRSPALEAWRDEALPRLFDLREIWLRVIAECRDELERPADDDDE